LAKFVLDHGIINVAHAWTIRNLRMVSDVSLVLDHGIINVAHAWTIRNLRMVSDVSHSISVMFESRPMTCKALVFLT
jgi:hypothetical protein